MIVMHTYDPRYWYWIVGGDESRAWSSATAAYVTDWPPDRVTRILNEQELTEVLKVYGLPGPIVSVPASVTPYQARIALLGAGLMATVEALMEDPGTDQAAKIAWEYATTIERDSPFIAALGPALGLTDEQIDGLFIAAAAI